MFFKRSIKRFAHVNGFTFVTYSLNGEIITSGTDGDLRIWKEISDDDPSSQCVGENGNCCVQFKTDNNEMRLLATSDNNVQAYKYPEFDREGMELRFNGLVTSIKVNKIWIVAGSEDHTIKARKFSDPDTTIELKGHTGPIFQIAINDKNHIASSSGDGTIKVWNLETQQVVKTYDGFEKFDKFNKSKNFCTPAFEKTGRYLAFSKGSIVNVVETSSWDIKFKLENNEIKNTYTACSFSHCGSYLAAGTSNGEISVWNLTDNSKIKGEVFGEETHPITSIEWNPKNIKEFAFCDSDGQLSTIKIRANKNDDEDADILMENGDEVVRDPDDIYDAIDFRDDDDEDNENCVALEKLKNETMKTGADSDSEDEDSKTVKSQQMSETGSVRAVKPFLLQPPFQPGATPQHLEHRFMVWNHVGQVQCHSTSDENSIIAEFHDTTLHPSLHILNTLDHQMASLSTSSLALATKETPCKLVCIALLSSGNKEWSTTMPECEEIQGIAAGKSFIAVATDAGYLRIFTTMGTQREVLMVPGPVVCMSAYDNKLVVAYHTSNTCNKYSIMIINILGLAVSNRTVEIPFAQNMRLNWLGFSDVGSIIAFESSGRVISYNIKKNLWMPICNLENHLIGASDTFFMISVSESTQKIRATLCRGTHYPLTNPRPILREIDYSLPLCSIETEKSKIEECLVRSVNFEMESSSKALVENGLKLFSTALNSELESRAFEIVELISDKKLIELASRYASQKGRMHMSNKISKLLNDFEEKEMEKKSMIEGYDKEVKSFTEAYEVEEQKPSEARKIETSTPLIAPRPMISQRKANPFKKSSNNSSLGAKALNHLTKKSIGYNESVTNSDDENTPTNNMSLKNNRSVSLDTPRPGNFSQWFIANKEDLKVDNPNSTDAELFKIAKNVYKELTQKTKASVEELDTPPSAPINKRKLELNEDSGSTAKLAKYGYTE
ncbi:unnamed protein product [Chironomus riparius]|uniref:WD repeat-containing protein 55 homolog n=1 Tax=Chironomus riparius TaxID=315576 RepID=A0A9N9RVQ6_9DIPT|nr:unnamed protein product [Chironomus riparius]